MTIIFCALFCEAAVFIKHYDLKKTETKAFSVYEDQEGQLLLVITGAGKISAANAVGFIAGKYDIGSQTTIINFGSAAGKTVGELVLGNKIVSLTSGRTYYPDMIIKTDKAEQEIRTADALMSAEALEQGAVYDMESSAIYQAASAYIGPHQMHFLKIISDSGVDKETFDPKKAAAEIEKMISAGSEAIFGYVDAVIAYTKTKLSAGESLSQANQALFERLASQLKCSVSMERELYQLFVYKELEGSQIEPYLADYYVRELLPCRSKREGKVLLDEIRRNMLK